MQGLPPKTLRVFYDLFVLLSEKHVGLDELISTAIQYQPRLKKTMIIKRLSAWKQIKEDSGFPLLLPRYTVNPEEIGQFILTKISRLE